jgi:hypothetical protein
MNKLKEMYNNGKAWLCGVSAELYLLSQGAGNANASSDNSYVGGCIDNIAETAKDAIEFIQSEAFSVEGGITTAAGVCLLGAGIVIGKDIEESMMYNLHLSPEDIIKPAVGGAISGGLAVASIAMNTAAYGWKGGVFTAVGEACVLGASLFCGRCAAR